MKTKNYRHKLGFFRGRDIIVESNNFFVTNRDEKGRKFLLLRDVKIMKIPGVQLWGNTNLDHIWVEIADEDSLYIQLARKIRVHGVIWGYKYRDGTEQVGIKPNKIKIQKYKKDIAREYSLEPGRQLSKAHMRKIIEQRGI